MRKNVFVVSSFLLILLFFGCAVNNDNNVPSSIKVKNFVWKGMNLYYLWQANSPDLADNRFSNQGELNNYLSNFSTPNDVFRHIRVDTLNVDRFSRIFSNYNTLEGLLSGTNLNNGMQFGLRYKSGSTTDIYGWVRYVLPNSDAASKNIIRGQLFYGINGTPLTVSNYVSLLSQPTYTVNFADYDNGAITPNGQSITLTKNILAENPVFLTKVISQSNHQIGYLMYNGFYSNYDSQLNNAFGYFQSQNITDLVVDLRYNSGGSVNSAIKLASMITGQYTGQLFGQLEWNIKAQTYFGNQQNFFLDGYNSLNLNKVYLLTSKSTASASELIINCLKPYINVVQIGDVTTGKNVGSITLYDSPDYSKNNVNPNHTFAMQPIVFRITNKNNFGDYSLGITPTYSYIENLINLGILGSSDEPLLQLAINKIINGGKFSNNTGTSLERDFLDSKSLYPINNEMYLSPK